MFSNSLETVCVVETAPSSPQIEVRKVLGCFGGEEDERVAKNESPGVKVISFMAAPIKSRALWAVQEFQRPASVAAAAPASASSAVRAREEAHIVIEDSLPFGADDAETLPMSSNAFDIASKQLVLAVHLQQQQAVKEWNALLMLTNDFSSLGLLFLVPTRDFCRRHFRGSRHWRCSHPENQLQLKTAKDSRKEGEKTRALKALLRGPSRTKGLRKPSVNSLCLTRAGAMCNSQRQTKGKQNRKAKGKKSH